MQTKCGFLLARSIIHLPVSRFISLNNIPKIVGAIICTEFSNLRNLGLTFTSKRDLLKCFKSFKILIFKKSIYYAKFKITSIYVVS